MFMNKISLVITLTALVFINITTQATELPTISLGEPLTKDEIKQFSINVFPDGSGLPIGQGSVQQGATLYQRSCSVCHGKSGIEGPAARLAGSDGWASLSDPLRILRINKYPLLLLSVGGLWPYPTTVYDYIRRAMPHYSPKSLSNNDVYAVTAYIFYLNDLVDKNAILTDKNLLNIEMPGNKRAVSAWPID